MSYRLYNGKELLDWKTENIPTLVEPILPRSGIIGVVGSSDTGKSSFLRQLALSVATGKDEFLGFKLNTRHQHAIYFSTEDDEFSVSHLLNKSKERYGDPERLVNVKFLFEGHKLSDIIDRTLKEFPSDLVVLDAFADIFPGDLNRVNEVRRFLNVFNDMARKHGCLFAVLHHNGKRTQNQPPTKDSVLGSQGFEAKMRALIEIRKDPNRDEIRHMCIVKGNYLTESFKNQSYKLQFESDMTFSPTFERTPFECLVLENNQDTINKRKAMDRALELKNEGMTYEDISTTMSKEGFKYCSKSTIGNWLKNDDAISIQEVP